MKILFFFLGQQYEFRVSEMCIVSPQGYTVPIANANKTLAAMAYKAKHDYCAKMEANRLYGKFGLTNEIL